MAAVLAALLPRLLARRPVASKVIDHGSKQALERDLSARLRGYAPQPDIRVLVLVDRDNEDCRVLKQRLEASASRAGLATKTVPLGDGRFRVVNRIVVEELEAWFLGDVAALRTAFPGIPSTLGAMTRFRDPDAIPGGTWEALLRVLQKAGHYAGSERLPKIEVARRVAGHMTLLGNRSRSFHHFVTGLQALLA